MSRDYTQPPEGDAATDLLGDMLGDTPAIQERVKELTPGILAKIPATLKNVLSGERLLLCSLRCAHAPHVAREVYACDWCGEPTYSRPLCASCAVDAANGCDGPDEVRP